MARFESTRGLGSLIRFSPAPINFGNATRYRVDRSGRRGDTLWFISVHTHSVMIPSGFNGSRETIVVVIDTGIDFRHPDLINNLWVNNKEAAGRRNVDDDQDGYVDDVRGWNFVDNSPDVGDDQGHGTAMAGIIAGEANNGQGISGVMWQASRMPLKALDRTGSGAITDVVEAIDYAAAHGAAVINCSFGTEGYSQALLDAINSVQIAAPGVEIVTTAPGGAYVSVTGTSAAAPLVAGVAGLLKTLRGWTSAQTIRQSLIDGARRSNYLFGQVSSGGVVSAGQAMTAMINPGGGENGPGGGGNGGGNGGEGGGGNGGGTGQANPMNLDYMRQNRPNQAEPRVSINLLKIISARRRPG